MPDLYNAPNARFVHLALFDIIVIGLIRIFELRCHDCNPSLGYLIGSVGIPIETSDIAEDSVRNDATKFYLVKEFLKMNSSNQQMRADNAGQSMTTRISSKEFAAKYRSKREIYNFLATDVGVYLPPYDNVTIYFIKDLLFGKKKMLSTKMVKTIHIPQ